MTLAALFLGFLVAIVAIAVTVVARYGGRLAVTAVLAGLSFWFIYVGVLQHFAIFQNAETRPPGMAFLILPVVIFLVVFVVAAVRSAAVARFALAIPLWILLSAQIFRVGVEFFLHQLWTVGLIPKMLTYGGANVDIYIGISAPFVVWLATKGKAGMRLALAWNVLGILSLANVVIRSVLTAPGPFQIVHAEVPNQLFGSFPYLLIPGFFVPLAIVLHTLAIRAITSRLRTVIMGGSPQGNPQADLSTNASRKSVVDPTLRSQESLSSLQQLTCELLFKNQQLRMSLEETRATATEEIVYRRIARNMALENGTVPAVWIDHQNSARQIFN